MEECNFINYFNNKGEKNQTQMQFIILSCQRKHKSSHEISVHFANPSVQHCLSDASFRKKWDSRRWIICITFISRLVLISVLQRIKQRWYFSTSLEILQSNASSGKPLLNVIQTEVQARSWRTRPRVPCSTSTKLLSASNCELLAIWILKTGQVEAATDNNFD